jgi:hypothetical protein
VGEPEGRAEATIMRLELLLAFNVMTFQRTSYVIRWAAAPHATYRIA